VRRVFRAEGFPHADAKSPGDRCEECEYKTTMLVEKLFEAYRLLGVSADSQLDEITKAYRRLAKKYHPDSNPEQPSYAHEMMMKINEAYALVKDSYGTGTIPPETRQTEERGADAGVDDILRVWINRFERQREEETARRQRELDRRKKESEALRKFWEKIILERKQEIADRSVLERIEKYARSLISTFYKRNYHNILAVHRQYLEEDFEDYVHTFKKFMRRIRSLTVSLKTGICRKKSEAVYDFLKTFIVDSLSNQEAGDERRASAFESYRSADREMEQFFGVYFSATGMEEKMVRDRLSHILLSFKDFSSSWPDSPMIELAQKKVEILEHFLIAFVKGQPRHS
jgi:curved DNA-binding protein CbpA